MGGPYNRDYSILGSILGSPYFGKLPLADLRERLSRGFVSGGVPFVICLALVPAGVMCQVEFILYIVRSQCFPDKVSLATCDATSQQQMFWPHEEGGRYSRTWG